MSYRVRVLCAMNGYGSGWVDLTEWTATSVRGFMWDDDPTGMFGLIVPWEVNVPLSCVVKVRLEQVRPDAS